ncbi:MAG: hypothetical protein ACLP1D_08930 [Xanthobacteraceae bacterium]
MVPDISEFSYGFALTRELIALTETLKAAPVFPSLIAEGKKGGGYDVNLDIPGFPLFIQFKRSECMIRRSARETKPPMNFGTPFYRMKITEKWRSAQHEMLLELDAEPNVVFYAAPLFHTIEELNKAYREGTVSEQSCYVPPSKIGKLDGDSHHVAFDAKRFLTCSEPREIEGIGGLQLPAWVEQRLNHDSRRFGDERLEQALTVAEDILPKRDIFAAFPEEPGERSIDTRLQRLADISLQCFGAQLFVVQRREAEGSP